MEFWQGFVLGLTAAAVVASIIVAGINAYDAHMLGRDKKGSDRDG